MKPMATSSVHINNSQYGERCHLGCVLSFEVMAICQLLGLFPSYMLVTVNYNRKRIEILEKTIKFCCTRTSLTMIVATL